ncbi:MAG: MFS transporter [Anaerolineaceae bacterium]
MRWFWADGSFASASDNIVINFISLYILALGATEAQVGLLSTFTNIICAIVLLPGALLAESFRRKRFFSMLCGLFARLAILLLVFVPILFKGPAVVWIAIAFSVLRDAFNNLGFPAWMTVINEVVPMEGRGRYFGSRNFIMGITGMATTLLAGKLITLLVAPLGYQIAFGLAFVLGLSSTFSYAQIEEVNPSLPAVNSLRFSFRGIVSLLKAQPQFVALTLTAALWNFAVNISGPFFNVFMVQTLKLSAVTIGFLAVVTTLTALTIQNQVGAVADRLGPRRLQLVSMFLIPLLPVSWLLVTHAWQIVIINIFSGIFWGAFNLVAFNLLLASLPPAQVPRYTALYQIVVMVSLALGALVGSGIVSKWGFFAVVIASALIRFVAAGLFAKFVRDPQELPAQTA